MWDLLQPSSSCGNEILDWILEKDLHFLNDGSATRTSQISNSDSIPVISLWGSNWSAKAFWSLAEPIGSSDHLPIAIEINHEIHYQPVIPGAARWRRNGVDWSFFTNEVESKMDNLPDESNLSLHVSRFNDILIAAAIIHVEKTKPGKNMYLGWLHTCEPKSIPKIASVRQSTKTDRIGVMLAVKPLRLSTRLRQKAGKISFKTECPVQTNKICGKSSKVWTVLLMPNHQTKQCPTTAVPSPTSNLKPMFSYTTMPESTNLTCHESIKISTVNLRNISMHHLVAMKAVFHLKSVSYYLPSKRWNGKEQLALTTFHLHFSSHSVLLPSKKYYPYSTHSFPLHTAHVSEGLP